MSKQIHFSLTEEQTERFHKWADRQDVKVAQLQKSKYPQYGAIGGGFRFSFTPTSIGMIITVENSVTKDELDLSEF